MNAASHRVRRVVFDLTYPDEPGAFAARRRLEDAFDRWFRPAIEAAFDAHASNGIEHVIDRIEIDLGRIEPERVEDDELRRRIVGQLARALADLVAEDHVELRGPDASAVATLLHYLRTGRLPWASAWPSLAELADTLVRITAPSEPGEVARVRETLQRTSARRRVLDQLGVPTFEWLAHWLAPSLGDATPALVERLAATGDVTRVRMAVLHAIITAEGADLTLDELETRTRSGLDAEPSPGRVSASVPGAPVESDERVPTRGDREASHGERDVEDAGDTSGVVYVRSAGIVLLHPFLPRFFGALDLLDEDRFRSRAAQIDAVHLLHHLATGEEGPEEPALTLHKLLCGLPVDWPTPRRLDLDERLRNESFELLTAVVGHWKTLKSTSVDALRATFLQRDGRLVLSDDRWALDVERQPVDVLLETLPWGLAAIRLPWLERVLWVDWG